MNADSVLADIELWILHRIPPGSAVLDLGCGDGRLLQRLAAERAVKGQGLEIQAHLVGQALERGVSVFQGDLDEGLAEYGDGAFDYVILNDTLQETRLPGAVLTDALRVGKHAIVAFPNFAYWKIRWQVAARGRTPMTNDLPHAWHNTPNLHFLSALDFEEYCVTRNWRIDARYAVGKRGAINLGVNWRATRVAYEIASG